jgi:DNA-binding NarL/FixJ family response regulator
MTMGEVLDLKINVFLLAGNRLFREALSQILRNKDDICVVGAHSCGCDALMEIAQTASDVLLIDPNNGDPSDLSFVQSVSRAVPQAKMVLIDMVDDESTFLRAVKAGAAGYVLQNASAADVITAVRAVHRGEAVCPPNLCLFLRPRVFLDTEL